ncbi:MAG TPA: hypothetical protein VK806_06460 [Bacteroidia bacterium]|nr:hypothetical protein [Bacteroidia bacterium]
MKKYIICALALLAAYTLKAGDTLSSRWYNKFTLGLNAGIALPLNQFASKAANNPSDSNKVANGYANTGYHVDFTVSYPVYWKLGVIAYAGYNMNTFDVGTYKSANTIGTGTFSAKNYTAMQYMAGPYFSMPIGHKFSVNARAMAGLVSINYPTQTTNSSTNTSSQWFNYTSFAAETETSTINSTTQVSGPNSSSFAYMAGIGSTYKLGRKTTLALNVAYTGSTVSYSSITYSTTEVTNYQNKPNGGSFFGSAGTNGTSTTSVERKFSSAQMNLVLATASIGITYRL